MGYKDRQANGLRRSPHHILTEEEISVLLNDIRTIEADIRVFKFNSGQKTSFSDTFDEVRVRGDVFPDAQSIHPRDRMSARAVLAHEYYGHRRYRDATKKLPIGSWNDEFRASYMAAKYAPGLADEDRQNLVLDAIERAKSAGRIITYMNL